MAATDRRRGVGEAMTEPSTRTIERALALLEVVCFGDGVTLTDCANRADLAPSTALRLLRTLEQAGFVARSANGQFRAGVRVVQLGARVLGDHALVTTSHAEMTELARRTGESVYLSVDGVGDEVVYIAIVEGTHSVRHASWVGRSLPARGSAAGQVLAGSAPSTGFVVVERGVEPDVTAIAAPLRAGSRTVAAVSLVVPSYRLDQARITEHGRDLVATCARLSAGLTADPRPVVPA